MTAILDKNQIQRAFSRHTGGGDLTAIISERLISRLEEIALTPSLIIDIGGDGRYIAARFPNARAIAIDLALPRLAINTINNFIMPTQADAEQLPIATAQADLAWSNLCFEWTNLQQTLSEAARVLRADGLLIFSALGRDTLREARAVFGESRVHGFMDMHDIGDILVMNGFSEPVLETERLTLTYRNAIDVLREIHQAGCGCALSSRQRGLTGRHQWQKSLDDYARRFSNSDGMITATYEIIYAVSWRKTNVNQEQVIHFKP